MRGGVGALALALALGLSLGGCLSLLPPPNGGCETFCEPFACSPSGGCLSRCFGDGDCAEGAVCDVLDLTCVYADELPECPDGLVYDPVLEACPDRCYVDDDCVEGLVCCPTEAWEEDRCAFGECVAG